MRAPVLHSSEFGIELLDEETYAVLSALGAVGYVYRAGKVYVALTGSHLAHAVEVSQSLSWDEAVAMVGRTHRANQ